MSGTLDPNEVSIIKTMLALRPKLSKQSILSYFTRPGRDINHARITEIAGGLTWQGVPPAPFFAALGYMNARAGLPYPVAARFLPRGMPPLFTGPARATLELTCWPVGQGLFMSGRLHDDTGYFYSWVYDCGSSSKGAVLAKAVGEFRADNGGRFVNLVTLSHFDKDHINGIEILLRSTQIGTLLLPYLPLWQRLLIAISEGIATASPLFDFFVNPVSYLTERGEIGEIVFVPAAGPDDVVPDTDEDPVPVRPPDDAKVEDSSPPDDAGDDPALSSNASTRVRFLKPAGRIVIPCLWEFVPYNDSQMQPHVHPRFILWAGRIAKAFVENRAQRAKALRMLKAIYKRTFGTGAVPANLISLFLYSGPVGTRVTLQQWIASCPVRWNLASDNFAQLSTGDGYLDTPARLGALRRFYGRDRLTRAGVLQVMHHGAKGNWHAGIAAELNPAVSIFSSNPNHKKLGHPHAEVVRDFWSNCPVQVDETNDFRLLAILALP